MYTQLLILVSLQVISNKAFLNKFEGEECNLPGKENPGKCLHLVVCSKALEELKFRTPVMCGFDGNTPIVCCENPSKSAKNCEKYLEDVKHLKIDPIVRGQAALPDEFPHMAALGFGTKDNITWQCGGSLISERFVLTAAHCLRNQDGEVKFVRLGDVNLNESSFWRQDFEIIQKIKHPEYKPPLVYNDIALLELNKNVNFTYRVKPACLYAGPWPKTIDAKSELQAIGWGLTKHEGNPSNNLQKVILSFFNNTECNFVFKKSTRRIPNGIVEDTQICAGGRDSEVDTCQGDSGGPLHTYGKEGLFDVVGITSFGKACGIKNVPAVYTKIAHYISWIENIVWK